MRPHTEHIRPPRALWVPFMLGRPLGDPDDPAFQTRVLTAALRLLERPAGPVLEDYDRDAPEPAEDEEPTILACPLPRRAAASVGGGGDGAPSTREQLAAEIAFLRPWYEQSRRTRGRTTVGVSGLAPEAAAELLADWIEGGDGSGVAANRLKLAVDDLRAYCLEAAVAQPGAGTNRAHLERWYWWGTAVGRALRDAHPRAVASDDPAIRMLGKVLMIPVAQRPAREQ